MDSEHPDDLATLSKLDNEVLMDQLRARYQKDKIYTYVGDILVAVNPYRPLALYDSKFQSMYGSLWAKATTTPHIFAVAEESMNLLLTTKRNQCCVVSGESGAGKTESAKYIIRQLIYLCRTQNNEQSSDLEDRILQVNPLLEAFGNAKTNMNDNSSRFGKYTELLFSKLGSVTGAKISEYLLEKSRVVKQAPGEQNFHILYYVFCSQYLDCLKDSECQDFPYFCEDYELDEEEKSEMEDMFAEVITAFNDVGFTFEERESVLKCLAGILHIGRLEFQSADDMSPSQLVREEANDVLGNVCDILQIDRSKLEHALVSCVNFTRGERVVREYTTEQSQDTRDAMAKAIYGRIFSWLVERLNSLFNPETAIKEKKASKGRISKSTKKDEDLQIGILDIYGFECFDENSFEQICINLANEYLQFFFNRHIFTLELEEYEREGIAGAEIKYEDNTNLLKLFLDESSLSSTQNIGLLALLDEECTFPNASEETLVQKFNARFKDHDSYIQAKATDGTFTIKHYAGSVEYNAFGFLEKNRDPLAGDVVRILQDSKLPILGELFKAKNESQSPRISKRSQAREMSQPENTANKKADTVGAQYKASLKLLIDRMSLCRPHFVRCIKPNMLQRPHDFDDEKVLIQLRYTGMLETTRIRREGFAVRPTFAEFIHRFKALAFAYGDSIDENSTNCAKILNETQITGWLLGKTKVFLKYYHLDELEARLRILHEKALVVQRYVRGHQTRKWTNVLLATARKQKESAAAMLQNMTKTANDTCKELELLSTEDKNRFSERRSQMLDESKRALARKRADLERQKREKLVQQAAEEKLYQEEQEQESEKIKLLEAQWRKDCETLNQDKSFQLLVKSLLTRKLKLESYLQQKSLENGKLNSELHHAQQALLKASQQSEISNRQLIKDMERGTPSESLKEQLRSQQNTVSEKGNELSNIKASLESHRSVVCIRKDEYDSITSKLVTVQKQNNEILSRCLTETSEKLSRLEDKFTSQASELETVYGEHDRSQSALAAQVREAEGDIARLQAEVDSQRNSNSSLKKDMAKKIEKLREELASKEEELESVRADDSATTLELNSKLKKVESDLENAGLEAKQSIQRLRSEIRQKSLEIDQLRSDKETAMLELGSRPNEEDSELSSQLRAQLRSTSLKAESAELKLSEQARQITDLENMLETSKREFASMISDLKRVIKQKEHSYNTTLKDKDAACSQLELELRDLKAKLDVMEDENSVAVTKLESELRAKERQRQTELELARANMSKKEKEKASLEVKLKEYSKGLVELKAKCERLEAESESVNSRLKSAEHLHRAKSEESSRTILDLQELLAKRNAEQQEKAEQLSQTINLLEDQLKAAEDSLARNAKAHDEAMAGAQEQWSKKLESMSEAFNKELISLQQDLQNALNEEEEENPEKASVLNNSEVARLQAELERTKLALAQAESKLAGKHLAPVLDSSQILSSRRMSSMEREIVALKKPIRAMGRQPQGPSSKQNDGADVDLAQYITATLGAIPPDVKVGRFTCKGMLSKQSGKHWQDRWIVFDLESKVLAWYVDDRELKICLKGQVALMDILSVESTDANHITIGSKRRNYCIRASSEPAKKCWEMCLAAIAKKSNQA
eukprot:m.53356 g.53356  ORF g.53356 m.53356 type:complete len:1619 (-) comp10863_c0_seq1:444-5300(-)